MGCVASRPPLRDTQSDTWSATDALGRSVIAAEETTPPRSDRFVGMFYFLWLGAHGQSGPHDITKILAAHPNALNEPDNPAWGPPHAYHHCGEPLFGYYVSDDRWVIRKHAQTLADAGVDTIIFDCSNTFTYKENYMALLKTFSEVRRDGGRTPQVVFLCPFSNIHNNASSVTADKLYDELYGPGLYPDLWFRWEGKPLILAHPEATRQEVREFFTFRRPEPSYFIGPYEPDAWSWLQVNPQHLFFNDRGEKEQMAVGVAQNAIRNDRLCAMSEGDQVRGRSWHDGGKDSRPDAISLGLNFAEQAELALRVDPKFVFITGWNEWVAMRLNEFNGVRKPVMFVDQFNQEYSRDIEPMTGGHTDNYYYQLVSFVRRYKGARKPPSAGPPRTIQIDGKFSDWSNVSPTYLDDLGDTMDRDHPGWGDAGPYVDATGRNDFAELKVARDDTFLYFYAKTRKPLTPSSDPDWMVLFIDVDHDAATGWESYDVAVNRRVPAPGIGALETALRGWNWTATRTIEFRAAGNELELAIPREAVGLDADSSALDIRFKWADNIPLDGDPLAFTLHGDTAPNNRFQYVYRETGDGTE